MRLFKAKSNILEACGTTQVCLVIEYVSIFQLIHPNYIYLIFAFRTYFTRVKMKIIYFRAIKKGVSLFYNYEFEHNLIFRVDNSREI